MNSTVTVRSNPSLPPGPYVAAVCQSLEQTLEAWIQHQVLADTALAVEVTELALSSERLDVLLSVSGTLKRLPVAFSVERTWSKPFENALEGRGLQRALHGAIQQQIYQPDPAIRIPYDRWREMNSELVYELLRGFEEAVGSEASPASIRMRLVHQLTLYAPVVMACAMVALFVWSDKRFGPKRDVFSFACQCLSVGAMSWLASYLMILCAGILSMPAPFFQREAEGIKLMQMTGVNSVPAVRALAVCLELVAIAALAGYLVWVMQPI